MYMTKNFNELKKKVKDTFGYGKNVEKLFYYDNNNKKTIQLI